MAKKVVKTILPPGLLVMCVLGSIFVGIATPTEAAGLGAALSLFLVVAYRRFTWPSFHGAILQTAKITAMAMFIVVGANCFTGVFLGVGGGSVVRNLVLGTGFSKWSIFAIIILVLFFMGMFIDWIGIVLITFPIVIPIIKEIGFNELWFVTITAVILQSSFLTPPFGYSLFFLKGVAPPGIEMTQIYRGIVPFCVAIFFAVAVCTIFPEVVLWLPKVLVK